MRQHSRTMAGLGVLAAAGVAVAPMTGCEQLPGGEREQATVIGAAGGAILGATLADRPLLGALVGGLLGAGAGYLIGANWDRITGDDKDSAEQAVIEAQRNPATAEQARMAATADVNGDGFITLDEVIAQDRAGFSDDEILRRLEATGQVFELTDDQSEYLINQGVSPRVVRSMPNLNREQRDELLRIQRQRQDVIGQPAM